VINILIKTFFQRIRELLVLRAGNLPTHVSHQGFVSGLFQNLERGIVIFLLSTSIA